MFNRRGNGNMYTRLNQSGGNNERALEQKFIDEYYNWISEVGERIVSLEEMWGITINQEQALSTLGKNILSLVPAMPIAGNSVVMEVIRYESNRVYKFQFKLVAKGKADGIRRETDTVNIEFLEVPGYKENPVYEHASARTGLSSYPTQAVTIAIPHEIAWRM